VKSATVFIDGGSRGNPGESGYGVVVTDPQGRPCLGSYGFLGIQTNNYAEYRGLLAALELALKIGVENLEIRSDSELLVRQINGVYRVKSPVLKPLHETAKELIRRFKRFTVRHIPRAMNSEADRLANEAMDTRSTNTCPYPEREPLGP
jgi:ribonuclease HI